MAELRRIADAHEGVPAGCEPFYVSLGIQPGVAGEFAAAAVDTVALAVLGKKGETTEFGGRTLHEVSGDFRPVRVSIYQRLPEPRTELEAANARLDEQATGDDSRAVHYLEAGSDGDGDDRMACGLRFGDAVKTSAYTGVAAKVTCPKCRPVADVWSE